jgi:hypothetical protein
MGFPAPRSTGLSRLRRALDVSPRPVLGNDEPITVGEWLGGCRAIIATAAENRAIERAEVILGRKSGA